MTPAVGYTEMRDSGFPDIGCVPSAWTIMKVKHIFDVICGATPKENPENWDGNIPWIGPSDMPMTGTIEHGKRFISELGYASCGTTLVPQNSIIISTRAPIGKICIAANRLCTNQGCKALVPRNKSINNRFFAYYLQSIIERLEVDGTGTTFKELSTSKLLNEPLIAPPISEQSAIAAYLDTQCAKIDEIIAEVKASIEDYKQWKASIIYEAVTKGLDPNVEMKDSGIEWIGEIPMDWNSMRFKFVATVKANLVDPKDYPKLLQVAPDNMVKDTGTLLPCNTVAESGVISWNHLFYKGQLLYSKIRPTLNKVVVAPFDGLCSADMYPIETTQNTKFMLYVMLSEYFVQQVALCTADRVKMPKINQEELGNITVIIPPVSKQKQIVDYLDSRCNFFDMLIKEKETLVSDLETYKKSLIYEVVTGKRRVC